MRVQERQQARLVFEDGNGARRPFARLERPVSTQGHSSVYIRPEVENPAYLDWNAGLTAVSGLGPDLRFSVHASGRTHLRHAPNANVVRYEMPRIEAYAAPQYVLTVLTPGLDYYPVTHDEVPGDVDINVAGLPPGFAVHLAVGPDLSAKVPQDKIRVPYPGIGENAVVHQIVVGVRPPLYFAAATVTVRGDPPPPPPMEVWAPIQMPSLEDYLPRPAVDYRPDPVA